MELNWAAHPRWAGDVAEPAAPEAPWPVGAPPGAKAPPGPGTAWPDGTGRQGPGPEGDGARPPGGEQDQALREPGEKAGRARWQWLREVSFRSRLSVLVAAAVGIAVALAALVCYVAVSRQLEQQVSSNLQQAVNDVPDNVNALVDPVGDLNTVPFIRLQLLTGDQVQIIVNHGGLQPWAVQARDNGVAPGAFFQVTPAVERLFRAPANSQLILTQTGIDNNPYRVAAVSLLQGSLTVEIGYPVSNLDDTLGYLRLVLILVAVGGVALAAALGWAVGRTSMRPVENLTLAAEHVAETQDLSAIIDETGNDELSRLARSFNAMLAALSASRQQQAQLVSDAGHELRTPLTSLRTNIEFLLRAKDLTGPDRDELLADVDAQLKELSNLVGDLVDLAHEDERPPAEPETVPFDQLVARAVQRAQRRAMSVHFDASLQPGEVRARAGLLERAVMNVLDNAAKWSPAGGRVTVALVATTAWHLTVTDEGPGVAPQDLPHIFERFYRAPTARAMPGSGLGLAIVKRVIASHGGSVHVSSPPEGGTRVEITLPLEDQVEPGPPFRSQISAPGDSFKS